MTPEEVASLVDAVLDEIGQALVGKRNAVRMVLAATLADGHVLIEDLPGLGKTLLVRSLAAVTGLESARIQFTPDLMPLDITGSTVLDPATRQPVFRPGPVFTHLLLADEINRAPAKTQAALLEAMQERQVTADGVTRPIEAPFLVIATQNPIEYEGTYPLPEAQLDRFILRAELGYPEPADEHRILRARADRGTDEVALRRVVDRTALIEMQRAIEDVHIGDAVAGYVVDLVAATRTHRRVRVGASPRGSLALMKLARVVAAMAGRTFVIPDDVQAMAESALAHRLVLRPEAWAAGVDQVAVVGECLATVPVPPVEPGPP